MIGFKAQTAKEADDWQFSISWLLLASSEILQERRRARSIARLRLKLKWIYMSNASQYLWAALIFLNFFIDVIRTQVQPADGSALFRMFDHFDSAISLIFAIELTINILSNWFWDFVSDGWNWFDTTVVLVSLIAEYGSSSNGVNTLRLLRAFRVFRLFRRLRSIRQIIVSLNAAIPAMTNAFVLVLLVTSIYSILGVRFYGTVMPDYFENFGMVIFSFAPPPQFPHHPLPPSLLSLPHSFFLFHAPSILPIILESV